MELISVIVPVYNAENYLHRCVDSIRNQTYTNLEIILVDDGSPDACPKICDEIKEQDIRVKVIHKSNAGQGLARNDGLDIATGSYVTFVDSDDWIGPDHVENLYNALVSENADASLGNHIRVTADGNSYPRMLPLVEGVYDKDRITDEIILPLIGADAGNPRDILINSSVSMNLYSMKVIKEHNIRFISERYAVAEDFYFNVDFFCHTQRIVYTKEKGYYYFQNLQSTCEKYNPKRFERTLNYYDEICKRVENYGLKDKVEHRIERSFIMKIRVAVRHIVLSDLTYKEKISSIKEILEHNTVNTVLTQYPLDTFVFSMRLLLVRMKKKDAVAVYRLMRLREKGRSTAFFKKILHYLGIGR